MEAENDYVDEDDKSFILAVPALAALISVLIWGYCGRCDHEWTVEDNVSGIQCDYRDLKIDHMNHKVYIG